MSLTMRFPLFKLPAELRLKIYTHYFRSVNQTYPDFSPPALLLTSRSVYTAAQPLYIKSTTFNLKTTANLLDYLASLPAPQIKQLRHLSLCALPLPLLYDENMASFHTYGFDSVLPLFPDLQLDTLTLTDPFHGPLVLEDSWGHRETYGDVKSFVERGCGWRQLLYRSKSTVWLQPTEFEYGANGVPAIHKTATHEQPGNWDKIIKRRDGPDSGAGVRMWIKEDAKWVEVPASDEHEDTVEEDFNLYGHDWIQSTPSQYGEGDGSLQIEIQITRGRDADIVDKGGRLDRHSKELHHLWSRMGWQGIKESGRFRAGHANEERPSYLL